MRDLRAYTDKNPYEEVVRQAKEYLPARLETDKEYPDMTAKRAESILKEAESHLTELRGQRAELSEEREKTVKSLKNIEPFLGLKFEVHRLLEFRYVKYRFGRISREYFDKFERYVYDTLDTIFYKCQQRRGVCLGACIFVPASMADQIDAVYASMHFEHIFLPDEYEGTPSQAQQALEERIAELGPGSWRSWIRGLPPWCLTAWMSWQEPCSFWRSVPQASISANSPL